MKNVYRITVKCRYTQHWMRASKLSTFETSYNVIAFTAFQAMKRVPALIKKEATCNGAPVKILDIIELKLVAEDAK